MRVRDDPLDPDPGFAALYAALPDEVDLVPWLGWCRSAKPPVLYLGIGTGRIAIPLHRAGIELVGVDAHPGMLEHLRKRDAGIHAHQSLIANLALERKFDLVIGPSSILAEDENRAAAPCAAAWSGGHGADESALAFLRPARRRAPASTAGWLERNGGELQAPRRPRGRPGGR